MIQPLQQKRKINQIETRFYPLILDALRSDLSPYISMLQRSGVETLRSNLPTYLVNQTILEPLSQLRLQTALYFAKQTKKEISDSTRNLKTFFLFEKKAFGTNPDWIQKILEWLSGDNLSLVAGLTDSTRREILKVLDEGTKQGWGVDKMVSEIESIDPIRAARIVRTELLKARNFAYQLAQEDSLFQTVKTWRTHIDERTRVTHLAMNGITVPEDEDFVVPMLDGGAEPMWGPGDPGASPGNVVNCRCWLTFRAARDKSGRLIRK